jgi:hypothetical protein
VERRCVRSENLVNEEALAHWGLLRKKQTNLPNKFSLNGRRGGEGTAVLLGPRTSRFEISRSHIIRHTHTHTHQTQHLVCTLYGIVTRFKQATFSDVERPALALRTQTYKLLLRTFD